MATQDTTAIKSIDQLRQAVAELLALEPAARETVIPPLGTEFLQAAEQGNLERLKVFLDEGFPLDYQDPRTGQTALHCAAASDAVEVVIALNKTERCNYLLRDRWGRLPSELAYTIAENPSIAQLLGEKERDQAASMGLGLTRRP